MSTFTAASSSTVTDLHKRVRYSTGLVLGVDEFEQEQAYLLERDRLHTRALHGYGTVSGLRVELGETSTGETSNELVVTPGLAVVPSGQHVCVGRPQCADLDEWVKAQDESTLEPHVETPESGPTLPVYVVLCYRECETDTVPIPGEPCRSADDSAAPSRIAEDFELQLRLTPPAQPSEDATRAFGAFLHRIQPTEHEERAIGDDEFEEMVKEELETIRTQVGDEGTPVTGSDAETPIYLDASTAHASLTKAFRMWSRLEARGIDTSSNRCGVLAGNDSDCVRLGTVNLTLQSGSDGYELEDVSGQDISVDHRPVLLETRLLQEYLAQGSLDPETIRRTLATVSVEEPETLRLWLHHSNPVELTGDFPSGVEVEVNGETTAVNSVSPVGTGPNAFDLTLGSPVDPGDRIAVHVPLAEIHEQDGPSLLERLDVEDAPDYLDRKGSTAVVYTVAPVLRLEDLEDVADSLKPSKGHVLRYGGRKWGSEKLDLNDLSDVNASNPDKHAVLITRDGKKWDSGKLELKNLKDVANTLNSSKGDVLRHGGRKWGSEKLDLNDLSDVNASNPDKHAVLITRDGKKWDSEKLDLDDLSDVDAPQPSVGEVLTWQKESEQESGRWVPGSGGTSTLDTDYVQTNQNTNEPYRIVAAGTVIPGNQPTVKTPKYGGLEASWRDKDNGLFLLDFDGYKIPGDTHSYVVKGTPKTEGVDDYVESTDGRIGQAVTVGFMFAVLEFTSDDGIIVQCIKQMIKPTDLAVDTIVEPAPFMVEISRIEGRQG